MELTSEQRDAVTILRMDGGENRFNPDSLAALGNALDTLEAAEGPRALVLTGTGKFFSNGLDLDWMGTAGEDAAQAMVEGTQALLARVLLAPYATVAALNGHTFAAGAMLAVACDERVMRADRGWFCLPEVEIGLPFTPGMNALLAGKLTPTAARRAMVGAERLNGETALALDVVDETAAEDAVMDAAVARAQARAGHAGPTQAAIKTGLYGAAAEALRLPLR